MDADTLGFGAGCALLLVAECSISHASAATAAAMTQPLIFVLRLPLRTQ